MILFPRTLNCCLYMLCYRRIVNLYQQMHVTHVNHHIYLLPKSSLIVRRGARFHGDKPNQAASEF
jgi:hypothetical protein